MVFKSQSGSTSSENETGVGTQAWNVADGYAKIKILRLIIQLDLDEEIAMFGRKDEFDMTPDEQIPKKRVDAFEKYIFHLNQLIGNCKFAIEKGGFDEKEVNLLVERIGNVEEVSDGIADMTTNDVTKVDELRINERHFKKCCNVLRKIKDELNFPINNAGLIFKNSDELDLDSIMMGIEQGG